MEIQNIGYNHSHDKNFFIHRQDGFGTWLFLLIKTPAFFEINDKKIITKPNSFILYSQETSQHYGAFNETYIDDWFHFTVTEQDKKLFNALNIPLNTVTELGSISELSLLIRSMTYEFFSDSLYRTDIIELYLKMIFMKLGQRLNSDNNFSLNSSSVYYERMKQLRNEIYNMPQSDWSIDKISKKLSMSRSGLQHTYKKIFGVAISSDIITSRLKRVRFYLSTTDLTLNKIAEECGYNSELYMMRQFKDKYGITPTEFRNVL